MTTCLPLTSPVVIRSLVFKLDIPVRCLVGSDVFLVQIGGSAEFRARPFWRLGATAVERRASCLRRCTEKFQLKALFEVSNFLHSIILTLTPRTSQILMECNTPTAMRQHVM
ncbi:hypothetical protein PILCRDRAFT_821627 [Piloderma croceum F 1598]|uniref:Uncharacterized protein n=1 Tax=Piloderma croceum (strain F 1598) TaxID=765440 RepID=A0A0C3FPS3_PILCF|nr:hypothetical protein PILCRDRAFT_821627 [Piloderma croceum F 1598]